ncbi:MAG TPA: DUF1573 domain-containing protein [Flavisolibacter sp.]
MKYLLIIFLGGLIACSGNDQQAATTTTSTNMDSIGRAVMADSTSYTTIEWIDSTHRDLGTVMKGQVVEVAWKFRNTGTKPLVISNVTAGCGCTVAERPQEPVAPNGESIIKASFNTKGQSSGHNSKSVTVVANTSGNATHFLTFSANVTD